MKVLLIGLLVLSVITIVFVMNYDNTPIDNISDDTPIRGIDPNITEKQRVDEILSYEDDYIPDAGEL